MKKKCSFTHITAKCCPYCLQTHCVSTVFIGTLWTHLVHDGYRISLQITLQIDACQTMRALSSTVWLLQQRKVGKTSNADPLK